MATFPPSTRIERNLDLDETGALVHTGGCGVHGWHIYNDDAGVVYVRLYDKATLAVATDTPKLTLALHEDKPAFASGLNIRFKLGLSWRVSVVAVDTDETDVGNDNDVVANLFWTP